jgi:hypothetical protein
MTEGERLQYAALWSGVRAYIGKSSGHYSHKRSTSVTVEFEDDLRMTIEEAMAGNFSERTVNHCVVKIGDYLEKLRKSLEEDLEDYRIGLCEEYEKQGYEEIDYQTSEERAKEDLSELEFDEFGEVFRRATTDNLIKVEV